MKTIVTLLVISFAILACGDEESGLQNSPPVIDHVVAPEPVEPGATVELQVVAHDADGDALSYVWEAKEGKLDSSLGRVVKWTAPTDAKSAVVVVHANDGVNDSTVKSKKIVINLKNAAPVIKRILVSDKVHAGARIQLEAITDDIDGDTLTFNWKAAGILSSETTPTTIWTAPFDANSTTITLTVDDGINEMVEKSADVIVIHSLIVPGKEAAGIQLRDEFDQVKSLYGKPDEEKGGIVGGLDYWDIGLTVSNDRIGHVMSLHIFEPFERDIIRQILHKPSLAKTLGGNGIRSTHKRVETEFGLAEEIKDGGKSHWYWKRGINFQYDAASKVERIYIFKPIGAAPAGFVNAMQRNEVLKNRAILDKYYTAE